MFPYRRVLELGAGCALPALVCALNGAKRVVATDYPDDILIANIRRNIDEVLPEHLKPNMVGVVR